MHSHDQMHTGNYVAETKGHTLHRWAKYYDKLVGIISLGREKRFRRAAIDLVEIEAGMSILDVGCGTGSLTIEARQQMGAEGMVAGLDPSSNMINLARQKAEKTGLEIDFQVGVIEQINYPDKSFDLVLSSLMMHHLPGDLKGDGLQEVYRVLKPGGRLLIVEIDPGDFSLVSLIHGRSGHVSSELESVQQYLEKTGFVSIETGKLNFRGYAYLKSKKPNS
jgi:ubiquinone/menaquinone biosynthesis C-methylase UbiE